MLSSLDAKVNGLSERLLKLEMSNGVSYTVKNQPVQRINLDTWALNFCKNKDSQFNQVKDVGHIQSQDQKTVMIQRITCAKLL